MKVFKVNLLDKETEYGFMPTMTAHIIDGATDIEEARPAVIVVPGGGYAYTSERESERVALSFSPAGFHTFILDYCVKPHKQPLALKNIARAIEIIRENCREWRVNPDNVAVCGFSAGGHLAASISTMWNDSEIFGSDREKNMLHRPNATILCYPVITCGEYAHAGSFENIIGENKELWEKYSLEKRVNKDTPPAFIWHTCTDNAVPVENSLLYASALRKNDIPFEMHIYPGGEHGLNLVSDPTYWKIPKFTREYPWVSLSTEWLYLTFKITSLER